MPKSITPTSRSPHDDSHSTGIKSRSHSESSPTTATPAEWPRPQPAGVSQRNQRSGSRASEPSLGGGFDLREDGRRLLVPVVDYRPVFPQDCGASDWGDAGNPGDLQGTGPSAGGFAGGGLSDPPFGSRVPVLQS